MPCKFEWNRLFPPLLHCMQGCLPGSLLCVFIDYGLPAESGLKSSQVISNIHNAVPAILYSSQFVMSQPTCCCKLHLASFESRGRSRSLHSGTVDDRMVFFQLSAYHVKTLVCFERNAERPCELSMWICVSQEVECKVLEPLCMCV